MAPIVSIALQIARAHQETPATKPPVPRRSVSPVLPARTATGTAGRQFARILRSIPAGVSTLQHQLNRGTDAASDQQLNVTPEPEREMSRRERTVGIRLEFGQEVDGGKTGERAIESEVIEDCRIPVFELILDIEQRVENGVSVGVKKK